MNATLAAWNAADESAALDAMLACCGSKKWAQAMVAQRPIANVWALSDAADRAWGAMQEPDWLEAFACHPRIGERKPALATAQTSHDPEEKSAAWSRKEQLSVRAANEMVLAELADDNERYEQRFGFTYIVCATGKSATEMLTILKRRLANDRESEVTRSSRAATPDHANSFRKVASRMSNLSTHVLDSALGKPAAGITVRLEKFAGGGWIEISANGRDAERAHDAPGDWIEIAAAITDADGRCREMARDAPAGQYRLVFDSGAYFARLGRTSIYPEIAITFNCDGIAHYHLPLLLSDNSYTTYRGS